MKKHQNISAVLELQISSGGTMRAAFNSIKAGARLLLLACISATYVGGQAMVEYGHTASVASASASAVSSVKEKTTALRTKPHDPSKPTAGRGATAEEINRNLFEATAGRHSAKLMLRSVPTLVRVQIDGKPVGRTSLLLIVAPGVHLVELSGGTRLEYHRQRIDLLPSETREVMLRLAPRYPAQLRIS